MPIFSGLSFIKQYITKPRTVGAVLPSSKYLANKMTRTIDFSSARCIVEYGAGTGVFTDSVLKQRKPGTTVILFEKNIEFYNLLCNKYPTQPNLHIINDSAEHIGKYLQMHGFNYGDYIISGLPFASLPQEVSSRIMEETQKYLNPGGSFITFQYTLLKKGFIGQYFHNITTARELRNVPPAYVLYCRQD